MKSQAMIVSPSLSKSNFAITIKLNSSILQVSNNINYLGVIIDSKLFFKEHILKLKSKLSRAVGIMCKLKHIVPLRILIRLYYGFFHSHLLYGLNSTILYSGLKILKFQDLIKLEIAKFMFSYKNCQLPIATYICKLLFQNFSNSFTNNSFFRQKLS